MNDFGGSLSLSDGRWSLGEEVALVSQHVAPMGPSPGGDRADAFACPAGMLHLCVLDACGHGAAAERVATFAQSALRVLICGGDGPGAALATLDRLLTHLEIESYRFVTAFVASLDASTRLIRYASAGHVEALLIDGERHEHLSATGPMLGLGSVSRFDERFVSRTTSAALVIATNGVLDSRPLRNPNAFLGTAGLLSLARSAGRRPGELSATRLIVEARRRAGGFFRDDAAVLVTRFKGIAA